MKKVSLILSISDKLMINIYTCMFTTIFLFLFFSFFAINRYKNLIIFKKEFSVRILNNFKKFIIILLFFSLFYIIRASFLRFVYPSLLERGTCVLIITFAL